MMRPFISSDEMLTTLTVFSMAWLAAVRWMAVSTTWLRLAGGAELGLVAHLLDHLGGFEAGLVLELLQELGAGLGARDAGEAFEAPGDLLGGALVDLAGGLGLGGGGVEARLGGFGFLGAAGGVLRGAGRTHRAGRGPRRGTRGSGP